MDIAEIPEPTPEQYAAALDLVKREYVIDQELRVLRCRRCGELVTWVSMHARERHGDDVEVWLHPSHAAGPHLW